MPSTSVQEDMDRAADAPLGSAVPSEGCTIWFRSDLRKFDGNPFTTDTPYGRAIIASIGNVFEERDRLEETVESLLFLLKRYRGETPLGHQPHMIAHLVDEAIAKAEGQAPSGAVIQNKEDPHE